MDPKRVKVIGALVAAALIVPAGARATSVMLGSASGTKCSGCGRTTAEVSVSSTGVAANYRSWFPDVSRDGRFVTFSSAATNLVANDTNGVSDVFVRDRVNGTTERVSVSSSEAQAPKGGNGAAISADGRYVAFRSDSNLTPDQPYGGLFLRDRVNGTTRYITDHLHRSSLDLSADGRYLVYTSDGYEHSYIFRQDTISGGPPVLVTMDSEGDPVWKTQSGTRSESPSISDDGRSIAFTSDARLHPADENGRQDVYVWNANTGKTSPVSLDDAGRFGQGDVHSFSSLDSVAISGDGTRVAFATAMALEPSDTNGTSDVYLRTLASSSLTRVSVGGGGVQSNGYSKRPSLSTTGDVIAFRSTATNLVSGDTNGQPDAFVRRLSNGTTERYSMSTSGNQLSVPADGMRISANGAVVVFDTEPWDSSLNTSRIYARA